MGPVSDQTGLSHANHIPTQLQRDFQIRKQLIPASLLVGLA